MRCNMRCTSRPAGCGAGRTWLHTYVWAQAPASLRIPELTYGDTSGHRYTCLRDKTTHVCRRGPTRSRRWEGRNPIMIRSPVVSNIGLDSVWQCRSAFVGGGTQACRGAHPKPDLFIGGPRGYHRAVL